MQENITFKDFNLSEDLLNALAKKGFEKPSAIQTLVIPELLKEQSNVIGQAQTGTGKTAAFSIPIIEKIIPVKNQIKALVLAPTRELAIQVSDEIYSLSQNKKIKVLPVYGGQSIDQQIKNVKKGVDIIVGTPGRVIDLMERNVLNFTHLDYFILDEADEMLNMGFIEDIEKILSETKEDKKMLFFSATMPHSILKIAKKYMGEYKILKVESVANTTALTEQIYFEVRLSDKFETLCRVLDFEHDFYGIIFAKTKNEADEITDQLKSRGYLVDVIHGDISQVMRNKTLNSFKNKKINILIATDVAARGIDVNNLTHVINYSVPNETESYVHRIGRTGRAGKKGIAITFVTPKESYQLNRIQKATRSDIKKQKAPSIKEIINAKKESLMAFINEIIKEDDYKVYLPIANDLLENHDASMVLAALLRHSYKDEFSEIGYSEIQELGFKSNNYNYDNAKLDDDIKLFLAMGKKDGLNPRKLLDILHTKAKTPARKVKDIRILDNFSFITVPYNEAEFIMRALNKEKSERPIVTKAKK
jgi:ATP-dependent RNA helicase DeaD